MTSPVVHIRPYREGDAPRSLEAVLESSMQLLPWMPWADGYGQTQAEQWVESARAGLEARTAFEFAIVDETDEYLGGCGLNQIQTLSRVANLGYWVRTSRAGRGIATAAARQLVGWAFANTDLERLEIVIAQGNTASCRVAEKLGARRDALLHKRLFLQGHPQDAFLYSIVRPG